jgi:hypothetical protein
VALQLADGAVELADLEALGGQVLLVESALGFHLRYVVLDAGQGDALAAPCDGHFVDGAGRREVVTLAASRPAVVPFMRAGGLPALAVMVAAGGPIRLGASRSAPRRVLLPGAWTGRPPAGDKVGVDLRSAGVPGPGSGDDAVEEDTEPCFADLVERALLGETGEVAVAGLEVGLKRGDWRCDRRCRRPSPY